MNLEQPKPDSKKYSELIDEIQKGIIKIPKFQREFVWSIDETAILLDSILKGYPIGTFILWETDQRLNDIKNIGNLKIPDTPENRKVQYVLDGQQRITSLFAAYLGAQIKKTGEKKVTGYDKIVINLDKDTIGDNEQLITAEPVGGEWISLSEVLNFKDEMIAIRERFSDEIFTKIYTYSSAFDNYAFSTVLLRKDDIDSAIEVFTRINTGGQTLTLFEIMSAKTYDEEQNFDMQTKWEAFIKELKERKYEGISSTVILSLLSLVLSRTKECKRKTILALDKQAIIDNWDTAISALKCSVDYFRTTYRIPVSQLLPYDSLLVPFAYFFYQNKEGKPQANQRKYLVEFFWRMSLSFRYSSAMESKLAQDIKRIDIILKHERPDYDNIMTYLDSPQSLIDTNFSAGNSYCKAILCLLAYQEPKDFLDNGKVILDNSWLKIASSKNYHHFFPKAYLEKQKVPDSNSLVNITFVNEHLNKRKIGAKSPSVYIGDFQNENSDINKALESHLIKLKGFGIESDDYKVFLQARSLLIYDELKSRIDLSHKTPDNEELYELIRAGESNVVEFKSTLRYDIRAKSVNKKLEYVIAKTIAAFLNSEGGDLFIGIDDNQNALGLSDDINTVSKKDIDGFELQVTEVIKKYIGNGYGSHIKITFPEYDDFKICRIKVEKSSSPVFTQFEDRQDFFVRSGCSSQPLGRKEQSVYEKEHWNN